MELRQITKLETNANSLQHDTHKGNLLMRRLKLLTLSIGLSVCLGCVVKEELDNTYNQAHLGLNSWSLLMEESGSYQLTFDAGYLIGLVDEEGVQSIEWSFELVNRDREIISYTVEQMREASPDKTSIFVEGKRTRELELMTLLSEGETYILWFTLRYRDEILHEQLFPLVAGEEGGDPNWIRELLGNQIDEVSTLANSGSAEGGADNAVEGEEMTSIDLVPLPD